MEPADAQLRGLIWLHTVGNRFTEVGVQQLAALQELEYLSLDEDGLSAAGLEFAARLPRLLRLTTCEEVPMTPADLSWLRARIPGVGCPLMASAECCPVEVSRTSRRARRPAAATPAALYAAACAHDVRDAQRSGPKRCRSSAFLT
jgi:hypothetical protein